MGAAITDEVVNGLTNLVIAAVQDPQRGVHIETALTMASATAGTLVLRGAVGGALDSMEPGSAALTDAVNEAGPALLDFVAASAAQRATTASPVIGSHQVTVDTPTESVVMRRASEGDSGRPQ